MDAFSKAVWVNPGFCTRYLIIVVRYRLTAGAFQTAFVHNVAVCEEYLHSPPKEGVPPFVVSQRFVDSIAVLQLIRDVNISHAVIIVVVHVKL